MRLIDRRLGLLFCVFFLLFSFALVRSFWLQGVQGGSLRAEARSQQVTTVTIPGERGRVLDRNGKVLAASEDAADVVATPYQVENPGRTAIRLHEVLGEPTADLLNALVGSQLGLRLSRQEGRPERRRRGQEARHHRHLDRPDQQAALSAGRARLAGDRRGRHRQPGPDRARALREQRARRRQRRGGRRPRRRRPAAADGDGQARRASARTSRPRSTQRSRARPRRRSTRPSTTTTRRAGPRSS